MKTIYFQFERRYRQPQIFKLKNANLVRLVRHLGQEKSTAQAKECVPQCMGPVEVGVALLIKLEKYFDDKAGHGEKSARYEMTNPRARSWVAIASEPALINLKETSVKRRDTLIMNYPVTDKNQQADSDWSCVKPQ